MKRFLIMFLLVGAIASAKTPQELAKEYRINPIKVNKELKDGNCEIEDVVKGIYQNPIFLDEFYIRTMGGLVVPTQNISSPEIAEKLVPGAKIIIKVKGLYADITGELTVTSAEIKEVK